MYCTRINTHTRPATQTYVAALSLWVSRAQAKVPADCFSAGCAQRDVSPDPQRSLGVKAKFVVQTFWAKFDEPELELQYRRDVLAISAPINPFGRFW